MRSILYKWKNHFYEMKGDVGMSLHEKERNKKMLAELDAQLAMRKIAGSNYIIRVSISE